MKEEEFVVNQTFKTVARNGKRAVSREEGNDEEGAMDSGQAREHVVLR